MSKPYIGKDAICPFYSKEDTFAVFCEGVEDNTVIKLVFEDKKSKHNYKQRCCYNWLSKCEIARMLSKKYDK